MWERGRTTPPQRARFAFRTHSPFYCSRRFGASRSRALLTRRLPTAGLRSCWSVAPAGRLISQPTYVLCLRKTRGRKLPERSTSRSNSSARPRSLWSRRRRRRPRGARATRDALTSAPSSSHRCRHLRVAALALFLNSGVVRTEGIDPSWAYAQRIFVPATAFAAALLSCTFISVIRLGATSLPTRISCAMIRSKLPVGAAKMASAQTPGQRSAASGAAMPPHPFDKRWHVHVDGKTFGPFTGHEIRQMVEQHRIVGSDFIYAEGESGSARQKISNDPVLGALFKSSKAPRSPLAPRVETSPRYRKWLVAIPVVVVAGWIVWPYYAVYDLAVAVRDGDVSTLESRVAWDSVRQGLRGDLNAVLLQKLSTDAKTDTSSGGALGAGLAVMLGPAIIDRMVESYVTPQAIAAAIRANRTDNVSPDTANVPQNFDEAIQAAHRIRLDQIKYAFFSGGPLTFRVEFIPDHDPPLQHPTEFRFQWDGNWKLTRIILPSDAIDGLSTAAKTQDGLGSPLASKLVTSQSATKSAPPVAEKLPPPLQIALVSKGFKTRNIQAGDFEDDITIQLAITNVLDKDIRAFDGVLTFTDLLDNEILSTKIAINEPLKAGLALSWKGAIKYNQFMDTHQRLRNEQQNNLKVIFAARKILFADGTTKDY